MPIVYIYIYIFFIQIYNCQFIYVFYLITENGAGNPVTGEGYRNGHDNYQSAPVVNTTKPVINKNRVPPGGFSSGLW